jgi:hypothetical protein
MVWRRPPGKWRSRGVLAEVTNQERVRRLLLKGGRVCQVIPGTVLLVHNGADPPDVQFLEDDGRSTTRQVRMATVVGVEL